MLGVEVEHDGQVRAQVAGGPPRDGSTSRQVERAAGALVGQHRVDVAVGDHDLAPLERGQHHGVDVLGLVGGVQQDLGAVGQLAGGRVEHDAPHLLPDRGVTGLEGQQGVESAVGERAGEGPRLGGLARPFAALEADEDPGGGVHAARLSPFERSVVERSRDHPRLSLR